MSNVSKPDLSAVKSDTLILKIAETREEIETAQHLRYLVFYEDLGAVPSKEMALTKRDFDHYDDYCDHLLVIDTAAPKGKHVIGTYRILRHEVAVGKGIVLYTETEYDLSKLRNAGANLMEVSRSCVLDGYRSGATINLLWAGLAAYVFHYKIDYLLGLPSFHGTSVDEYKNELGYLKALYTAPDAICPRTHEKDYVSIPDIDINAVDQKEIFKNLPPLLKGYIRLGGVIGDGAFVDSQFNTVDICIMVQTSHTTNRYLNHYKRMFNIEQE